MEANKYQEEALKTAIYPNIGSNYIYPTLGLAGEVGEICEKVKKIIRDKNGVFTDLDRIELRKELGDVCWYIAICSREFGFTLNEVMEENIKKLKDRADRNMLHGSGDNR
jgi:NTP pyrophosphatase (non-canonical NTP hydrolase)